MLLCLTSSWISTPRTHKYGFKIEVCGQEFPKTFLSGLFNRNEVKVIPLW